MNFKLFKKTHKNPSLMKYRYSPMNKIIQCHTFSIVPQNLLF